MKKIREWEPWVKMSVGGVAFAIGMTSTLIQLRAFEATGEVSGGLDPFSFFSLAGSVLIIWGTIEALKRRPRLFGGVILAIGLILLPLTVLSLPTLWEWSKGGVVNFIPAPFLVPLVLVIPGLLIFYGIGAVRGK